MVSRSLECRRCHSINIAILARFRAYGGSRACYEIAPMAYNRLTISKTATLDTFTRLFTLHVLVVGGGEGGNRSLI